MPWITSDGMGLVIASLGLSVGAFGLMKLTVPEIETWSEGKELVFGVGVVILIAASFLVAIRLAHRQNTEEVIR